MKKACFVAFMILLYVSCKYRHNEDNSETAPGKMPISKSGNKLKMNQEEQLIDLMDKIKVTKFDLKNIQGDSIPKQYFITSLRSIFPEITINDINKIDYQKEAIIRNWGKTSIYKFELSHRLPEVIYKSGILIIGKQRAQAAIFLLDNFSLVKLKKTDTAYFLSGMHIVKSKGYFYLYEFDGEQYFQCKFNTLSDKFCTNGIPVYNNGLECICYKPFGLTVKNNDVNQDGLLDLSFSGDVLSFCEGLENGYGREDRKPLSIYKLNIIFIANQRNNEIKWTLRDSSFCSKINR